MMYLMTPITHIDDLRRLAKHRLPRIMFDYVDSGSYDEITMRANRSELQAIRLQQRVLVDATGRSMATELLGVTA
jgi:L-lactate dehydrogenase (cytochrome)